MGAAARVLVLNADECYSATLRSTLLGVPGVKIVAEVDEAILLPQAIERFPCELLVANLDPLPEAVLPILGDVATSHPELLVFAVSESTDGQLILQAMRKGIREFLTKPIETADFQTAFERFASQSHDHAPHGTLITVIGGAGGVGASTLAVNLAAELKQLTSGNVTVVDLDHRFGQVATLMDVEPLYTIADLCETPEQVEQSLVEKALVRHTCGVRVLGRPLHFAQADNITAAHCVGVLSALVAMNEYVVVDGPNRFDFGTKAVLDIADINLLVLQLVVPTVRSVHRMLEGMKEVGFNLDRMRLICNRVGAASGGITVEDVASTLGMSVFSEVPDDWNAVSSAANIGGPLLTTSPKSRARLAVQSMAQRVFDPEGVGQIEQGRKKKGLLSKILQ